MKIANDTVVSLDYRLHLGDGVVIDQSEPGDPLVYLHGHEEVVPGLERALEGKVKGDKVQAVVKPEDGYGDYDPEGLEEVPKTELPPHLNLEAGEIITGTDPEGEEVDFLIKEVKQDTVVLDFNHPMAGKTLHFDVTVLDVREPTDEEREHGHAHGPGDEH